MEEKSFLTYDEAVSRLNPKGEIHTFRNSRAGLMLGCDWSRKDILKALANAPKIEETGPGAQSMNHGIAVMESGEWLFIETQKPQ